MVSHWCWKFGAFISNIQSSQTLKILDNSVCDGQRFEGHHQLFHIEYGKSKGSAKHLSKILCKNNSLSLVPPLTFLRDVNESVSAGIWSMQIDFWWSLISLLFLSGRHACYSLLSTTLYLYFTTTHAITSLKKAAIKWNMP